jgi:hypothetical protein
VTRTCTICSHPSRAQIDQALVAGTSYRDIARQFQVSKDAAARHASEHIAEAISKHQEAHDEAQALDVVKQLKAINGATLEILTTARRAGNAETALKAIDRIQRQIELQAKLLGDLSDAPTINVLADPEWIAIRTALMRALSPYVEARVAVSEALRALETIHEVA